MTKPKQSASTRTALPAGPAALAPISPPNNVKPLRPAAAARHTFDPATTLIRMQELEALTGYARATVYKRLKDDPTFPKPVPLSDSTARGAPVAWVLAEVQSWVLGRIAARGKVAA
ncbi:helix-turn-helix transcriptional regulator [Pseudomonas sp.]|uniref:helix-turn-helix transcriptional regulator n=1 Tax=Pseudomonas sp. TaxID=306 RepID=UPI0035238397